MKKRIFMIAGPNGSGKTTTAREMLPSLEDIYDFINADEIARGLAPMHPETVSLTASKLMLRRFHELLDSNKSFAFETTAAGTNYIKHLQEARTKHYEINLVYLWLIDADLAVKRVEQRVSQGGHNIPEETVRRRYQAGIKNVINSYLPCADKALIVDNSISGSQKLIARKHGQDDFMIDNIEIWEKIVGEAHGKSS